MASAGRGPRQAGARAATRPPRSSLPAPTGELAQQPRRRARAARSASLPPAPSARSGPRPLPRAARRRAAAGARRTRSRRSSAGSGPASRRRGLHGPVFARGGGNLSERGIPRITPITADRELPSTAPIITGDQASAHERQGNSALSALGGVPRTRRPVAAQPPRAHLRAAGQARGLQEAAGAAGHLRGRGPDRLRDREPDQRARPGTTRTRAPGSSRISGPASTAPCWTSCGAATGRRARCAASSATSSARATPSPTPTAARRRREELGGHGGAQPRRAARQAAGDRELRPDLAQLARAERRRHADRARGHARVRGREHDPERCRRLVARPRTGFAPPSASSPSASARWRFCSTSRTSPCARSARCSACPRAASPRSTASSRRRVRERLQLEALLFSEVA